jgi:chromosome condensin MukBEF ATPase and DNA-binding subunit MukB
MKDLRSFIKTRRQEIRDALEPLATQRQQIQSKIDRLERELSDLNRVAKTIGIVNGLDIEPHITSRSRPELTIKEAALKVLRDHPEGLIALDILKEINERFGLGILRTSLSPQLSRLKQERKVNNAGMAWTLASRAQTEPK